ncbi:ATP-binding protein [Candidatus Omnitrophota bacterium]
MMANFRGFPITSKFILWFLIISLIPLIVATYISYNSAQAVLKKEISNSLIAVADNKVNQIEAFLDKKVDDVNTLSHMSDVIYALDKLDEAYDKYKKDSPEYIAIDQEFRPFFTYYQKTYGYEDIFLIRAHGDIIFAVNKKDALKPIYRKPYKDTELARAFLKSNISTQTEISDCEFHPADNNGAIYIAAPIFKAGDVVGAVVAQMGTEGLFKLAQNYSGLGKTGETIIAAKIGQEITFLAPLRFDADAAFKRKITIGSKDGLDIQKAVSGKKDLGINIDYRGEEVLSVSRHIPSFRWGMAVKMNTEEVFSPAGSLRNTLLIISLILLILVILAAVIVASTISRPIRELTKISGEIAGGDLSARAEVMSSDEIGDLANTFNLMTDKLVKAKANVEQKKAQVEEQKKMLEKVNKELDSFVYTASHDLRAPLRAISSFSSFLKEDYFDKFNDEGKGYLKEIYEGADRMDKLIGDLLELSRISRIQNPYEEVDIRSLIDSVVKRIEFDIKTNKVDLKIGQGIPVVTCDRIKISEVFLNLINNAIKFSSKNPKDVPTVEVGYVDDIQYHKFYVKDNGIGIDPQHHEQVFGIFKRLHTMQEYEGTGAGLSIVKKVIDDHGGKIWIESKLGEGATFCFTIPKTLKREEKKLGEILIEDGAITKDQLSMGLKKQGISELEPPEDDEIT